MLRPERDAARSTRWATFAALLRGDDARPGDADVPVAHRDSHKDAPNENYARELMELFTLGTGYTEDDIREASRALTGFCAVTSNGRTADVALRSHAPRRRRQDDLRQDRQLGLGGRAAAVLEHPAHAGVPRRRSCGTFFVPTPIPRQHARQAGAALHRSSGRKIAPLVRAHPRPPAPVREPRRVPTWSSGRRCYVAGQLRTIGAPGQPARVHWLMRGDGPAAVPAAVGRRLGLGRGAGCRRTRCARASSSPTSWRAPAGRCMCAERRARARRSCPANEQVDRRADRVRRPGLSPATVQALLDVPRPPTPPTRESPAASAEQLQRALRHLLVSGPDNQLC